MKQRYTILLYILFLVFSVENVIAQNCSTNFTIKTASTPSTCQANGTVTVTLEGDIANLYNIQYGLTSNDGFSINPQEHNILTNIPAGTYSVSVRAFCKINGDYDVVKTVTNVVVGGNYKVPSASFNATSSRKSYDICNTGIIALNVSDGSGNFTFNITSAPSGVTTGVVVPTKNGTLYTLPSQDYPSGDYIIQINDGCYTSVCTFSLGQITGFPGFTYNSYSGFRPTLLDNNCSNVYWYAGTVGTSDPDYYRYFQDGMYEVGAAPAGSTPTRWVGWTTANLSSYRLLLDLSPNTYSDFYAVNSISIYTRLKGCETGYSFFSTYMRAPSMSNSISPRACANYNYTIKPWTDYDGMLCYPLSIEVTRVSDGQVVLNNPSWSYNSTGLTVTLDYDTNYKVTMTGANGKVASSTVNANRNLSFTTNLLSCDSYKLQYLVPSGNTCWPVMVSITDASGKVVCTDSVTTTSTRQSCPLNYGENYTFKAVYVNSVPEYTYTVSKMLTSSLPTAHSITASSGSSCIEDYGYIYIRSTNGTPYPVGTVFTVTGPPGYTPQTATVITSYNYYSMPYTTLPPGTYTITADYGCGTPVSSSSTLNGLYSGKALSYTTENTCSGMKVIPSGSMTYQGNNTTTYYRLVNGPVGYDKTVITPGKNFVFSTPGKYILGILNSNSATGCVIKTDTINYTAPPLALSQTGTNAYECVDNATGVILLKAINGVAPYTYQLWNKDNTAKVGMPDIVSNGQVNFMYGQADSTYTARIIDQCGNMFSQQITMAKLSTARIVYSPNNNVCTGDSIFLKCITLGQTAYNWTGPDNFSTTTQNPKIGNADITMSGWYKVTVMPEFCGDPVQDSVYINVYPPLAPGTVSPNQELCVRSVADTLSCPIIGGSNTYTYQWQSSTDGLANWTNITGATNATYIPSAQISSGRRYYRLVASDVCGTVYSGAIAVEFKPCYIPVNPNIQSRGGH